jgi:predicted RNase H-like HicB family nuclease
MSLKLEFEVKVVIEPDEGGYHAYCPALKGLHTCGASRAEARSNARDAVIAYLESLMKHGDPFPKPEAGRLRLRLR